MSNIRDSSYSCGRNRSFHSGWSFILCYISLGFSYYGLNRIRSCSRGLTVKQDLLGTTPSISYGLIIMERSLQAVVEFGMELTVNVPGDMDSTLAEARTDK